MRETSMMKGCGMTKIALCVLMLGVLGGCAHKTIYLEAKEGSTAVIEADMTGGRITITGPFKYCSQPNGTEKDSSVCPVNQLDAPKGTP
jgi:hypothetical protein